MYAMDDLSPGNDWLDSGGLDLADARPDGGLMIERRGQPRRAAIRQVFAEGESFNREKHLKAKGHRVKNGYLADGGLYDCGDDCECEGCGGGAADGPGDGGHFIERKRTLRERDLPPGVLPPEPPGETVVPPIEPPIVLPPPPQQLGCSWATCDEASVISWIPKLPGYRNWPVRAAANREPPRRLSDENLEFLRPVKFRSSAPKDLDAFYRDRDWRSRPRLRKHKWFDDMPIQKDQYKGLLWMQMHICCTEHGRLVNAGTKSLARAGYLEDPVFGLTHQGISAKGPGPTFSDINIGEFCAMSRVSGAIMIPFIGRLGAALNHSSRAKHAWAAITMVACCDGRLLVTFEGSTFPNHWGYINSELVWEQSVESDRHGQKSARAPSKNVAAMMMPYPSPWAAGLGLAHEDGYAPGRASAEREGNCFSDSQV